MQSEDQPKVIAQFKFRNFLINRGLIPQGTVQGNRGLEGLKLEGLKIG